MIFIIGGKGFVGSAYARWCEAHHEPYVVITKQNYADFKGSKCDVLINANGNSKKYLAKEQPMYDFDASVRSVRSSLEDFEFGKYVYLSSCDVYPDCSSPESTREDSEPDVSEQSPYGFHKYLAEQCVRHQTSPWLVIRQGGFVGPGLLKNPIYDILHGSTLWVDPSSELQYMHTDDSADIVMRLVRSEVHSEIINISGAGVVNLQDVIGAVSTPVTVRPGSPTVKYEVNTSKLSQYTDIPHSRLTVMKFLREHCDEVSAHGHA